MKARPNVPLMAKGGIALLIHGEKDAATPPERSKRFSHDREGAGN